MEILNNVNDGKSDREAFATKDSSMEQQIPTAWRQTFRDIVAAFARADYRLEVGVVGAEPVPEETAIQIQDYLEDYDVTLVALPEETWKSSVCVWTGNEWDVVIDLWTQEEGRSDLVLHAQVRDVNPGCLVKVHLVYVP